MDIISFDKAKKIWKRIIKSPDKGDFSFELEVYKRLLDYFHVGPYYYYVFNCGTAQFEFLDEKATEITGYPLDNISPQFLVERLHPKDVAYFLSFENSITNFYANLPVEKMLDYKTSYDVRFKMQNGNYIRILQQVSVIQVDAAVGSVFRTLGVHTDITNLKPEGKPILNIVGLNGEPSFYNVSPNKLIEAPKPFLTNRERQIVRLIIEGNSSEMIADQLCISMHTVKTHRRNIHAKAGTNSAFSLAKKAIDKGWI